MTRIISRNPARSAAVAITLGLLLTLTLPALCRAAANDAVYFPNGVIPYTPLTYGNGQEMRVVAVVREPLLLLKPDLYGGTVFKPGDENAPHFLDPFVTYAITEDDEFLLVQAPKNGQWGWISREHILQAFEPLRSSDKTNPAFIKVVAKNNWRTSTGELMQSAPILNGPGPGFDKIDQIDIFNIRYAYDIRKAEDGNEYVLVGHDPELNLYNTVSTLSGWIRRDNTILWESRIGVYYDKTTIAERTEPVMIYKDLPELEKFNQGQEAGKAIAFEDMEITKPLPYHTTRFPVIGQSGNDFIQIAFVGDGHYQNVAGKVSSEEISRTLNKSNLIADRLRNRDVLFLIDATDSMDPYYEAVLEGIKKYLAGIDSENEQNRFRFGLGIYRDYDDPEPFAIKANLGEDVYRALKKVNTTGGGDAPEAFYQGIVKTVEETSWREGSTRAVIVLGDHGNHNVDLRYNLQQVATSLEQNRISFYSVNLNCPSTPEHIGIFNDQAAKILELRGEVGQNFSLKTDGEIKTVQTRDAIVAALQEIEQLSSSVSNALIARLKGKELTWGTQTTKYLQEIINETKLNEQINLSLLSQVCEDGWVAKKSRAGINQLQPWVLMERTELEEMLGFMAGLYKLARRRVAKGLGSAVKEITQNASGDAMSDNERISEYLQRRLHIPFREVSDVLQYSPSQLEEKFRDDDAFKDRFVKEVGKKYVLLQAVAQEKSGDLQWNQEQERWTKLNPVEQKWWVITPGGSSYAWLPMTYLP